MNQLWAIGTFFLHWFTASSYGRSVSLPSYPLAVKSPYLSTWVPGHRIKHAPTAEPQFWTGEPLNWPILAYVSGTTYTLFGAPNGVRGTTAAHTINVTYTSSHTLVFLTAGTTNFTLDFFSPVLPGKTDYAVHSLPYSYLTVNATSSSNRPEIVTVLSAIDQSWTGQEGAAGLNFTTSGRSGYFWFYNPDAIHYTENKEMASWGSVLYAAPTGTGTTHTCDSPANVYEEFVSHGSLQPKASCSGSDFAAIVQTIPTVGRIPAGVTFAVGLDRVNAVNFVDKPQTGYYRTKWPTIQEAVPFFLSNYQSAYSASLTLDADIRSRALSVSNTYGSQYADIVEASVRQAFGAIELTVPANLNASTISAFLKEISSNGNVNTVDVVYQSWPIFVSLNPEYIALLYQPVLSYLQSGKWPHDYVIHDIGSHYPNATGHPLGKAEFLPLSNTSTMFILLLVYQKLTGDTSFAQQFSKLLDGYAQYLVSNTLYPIKQLNSVDAIRPSPNQTALAVQGAIGLNAASILLGNQTYAKFAASYANTIYNDGLGLDGPTPSQSKHFTFNYGDDSTWNVLFPAYSDVFLNLSTFPASAWQMQSDWYASQIQAGGLPYAGPSTNHNYTGHNFTWGLTDWNVVVASVSSPTVQEAIVNTTWAFMTNGLNHEPFGTKYEVEGPNVGKWVQNRARSTVGSHFAIMALQQGTWYKS